MLHWRQRVQQHMSRNQQFEHCQCFQSWTSRSRHSEQGRTFRYIRIYIYIYITVSPGLLDTPCEEVAGEFVKVTYAVFRGSWEWNWSMIISHTDKTCQSSILIRLLWHAVWRGRWIVGCCRSDFSPHLGVGILFLVVPSRRLPLTHTHTWLTHNSLTHNSQLPHTHTTPSLTHNSLTRNSVTHNFFTHNSWWHWQPSPSHTQLAHTQLVHTQLTHTQLSHTQLTHSQLVHTQLTHRQLPHTQLAHTQLAHTHLHFGVARVALGDINLGFAWHAWYFLMLPSWKILTSRGIAAVLMLSTSKMEESRRKASQVGI